MRIVLPRYATLCINIRDPVVTLFSVTTMFLRFGKIRNRLSAVINAIRRKQRWLATNANLAKNSQQVAADPLGSARLQEAAN